MPPEVTVLTAVRNGGPLLLETVSSIRAQTFTDWEYIIVDDASEDQTQDVLRSLARAEERIRIVLRSERGGPYAAANEGVLAAKGRYVVRIDADDVAVEHRIEHQIEYLKRTGLRACGSFWQGISDTGDVIWRGPRAACGVRALKWWYCVRQIAAHSTACMERNALEEIGGYRELPASQDLKMWCEFARRHWLGIVPEVLVSVRRPGRLTSSATELQERLAVEVLTDHFNELTNDPWSEDETRALRPAWSGHDLSIRLLALDRWVRLWGSGETLSIEERRELSRLARSVRWSMTRQALRRERVSVGMLRGVLSPKGLLGAIPR